MTWLRNFHWPHIGQRIVKTAVAVFLCMVIYYGRGYWGSSMPTEAAITAIVCMQPFVSTAAEFAISRFIASLIGGAWGLALLLLLSVAPALGENMVILYGLMGIGILLSLYSTILIDKPDTSSLAAIVFICVVAAYPDIQEPLKQSYVRMLDILIGTGVAIFVNTFRLPRVKRENLVFFVKTEDLVPDNLSRITPAAMFRLNSLYNDGARICLCSEHAPAFFALQMNPAKFSVPMVVMDGAAIYDADENRYLWCERMLEKDSTDLKARMEKQGISFFTYTIHKDRTCIFHNGKMRDEESDVFERMRRSPYRRYLEDDAYDQSEIIYLKVIAKEDEIGKIEESLKDLLTRGTVRHVIRHQAGGEKLSSLYIYHHDAVQEKTKERVMKMLQVDEPLLRPEEVINPQGYQSERDVMHFLHRIEQRYEPVRLFSRDDDETAL